VSGVKKARLRNGNVNFAIGCMSSPFMFWDIMVYYLVYVDSWLWVTMYVLERMEARNRMNSL
jgi:hypothetical protein